ncbi:alpha-amylase 2B [Folsomia candida]|uniref:alpha-amylase 2B n=1 Tax=Folsomia candida TaxID=158441 RepID=UPI000B8F3887|nr:alpha-amylase 2B [Folsomia candida]
MKFYVSIIPVYLTIISHLTKSQFDPQFVEDRTTMVHLFEWKWNDIALECERFLGPRGFGGVQVSPPNENVIFDMGHVHRPWFERYQPTSYKLETRSGTEEEFKNMVKRCNDVGVRIYVDAVINHMTSFWPNGTKSTGGSSFSAGATQYDAVPFTADDFNNEKTCPSKSGDIENYGDEQQVRNCKLLGLNDLDHSKPHVQDMVAGFLNKLVKFGVAGFRIDASKHMWPKQIHEILSKVDNLNSNFGFKENSRPFIYQEVIDLGNEPIKATDYLDNGRVTEFKYGANLGKVFRKGDEAKFLRNFGEEWNMLNSQKALVFIDNHDNQRGHGAGGSNILTFRNPTLYKIATAFMLSWPFGVTKVMSSYSWEQKIVYGHDQNDWIGPPQTPEYEILNVTINEDLTCGNGWVCEHRWTEVYKMVEFRNIVGDAPVVNWWDNGLNQIAFGRQGKGFVIINNDDFPVIVTLNTTLASGTYCDIISGGMLNKKCLGISITVNEGGNAEFAISNLQESPFIVIHMKDKIA